MSGKRLHQTSHTDSGNLFLRIILVISFICLIFTRQSPAATVDATADANFGTIYQQIEGFGGAICYDMQAMANYSNKNAVYDLLFRDLGLDILRIKNTYQISSADVNATARIVIAGKSRNPALKTFLLPWSPAASLKSDGYVGGTGHYNGTLKKDATDPNNSAPYYYVYNAYANWWLNSLIDPSVGFNKQGVYPDYITIQNEPDWGQQDQECLFDSTENSTNAGYDKAFQAVYNKLNGSVSPMPKMLAPEMANLTDTPSYINALVNLGQINNIYGFSHHLYDQTFTNPDDAAMITRMQNFNTNYIDNYNKPAFMTEYGGSGTPDFNMAMDLAQHIYNCLVYEGVTSYVHWSLIRDGSYTTGGAINLPTNGNYIVRDLYWFIKQYSFFVQPGWYRAGMTTTSSDLCITAFRDIYDSNMAIVILNKSATNDVNLTLTIDNFTSSANWLTNDIYRSSATQHWAPLGAFDPCQPLTIPAQSITTIHIATFQTCADVQNGGYTLNSDLNGDCHVDFYDFIIIADNWLRNDCNGLNNWCNWADWPSLDGSVDLSDLGNLVHLWTQCNNPLDPNCTPNW